MSIEVYGRLIDATQVEDAVEDSLKLWLPAYIAEVERQNSMDPQSLPLPASYSRVNEFYKWSEDQLPAVLIVSPGLAPTIPKMKGNGIYHCWWRVGVAIIAAGQDRETTRMLAKRYTAAVRGALLQHAGLGDFGAEGITWNGERNSDVPDDSTRTLGSGACTFDVEVSEVVNARLGPSTPPDDPYVDQDWPEAQEFELEVTTKEED